MPEALPQQDPSGRVRKNIGQLPYTIFLCSLDVFNLDGQLTRENVKYIWWIWDLKLHQAFGWKSEWILIIGPESDHCLPLSLTDWLTDSCLVNLIDVTLACEDGNSKHVEVVTVVDVDDEDRVGNSLLQIWELRFGLEAIFFRYWAQGLIKILNLKILKLEFG